MLHFRMGGVLAVSGQPTTLDQIRRVATFCGSSDVRLATGADQALGALHSMEHAQLVAFDLRLGTPQARRLLEGIQKSSEEHIRWLGTLALLPSPSTSANERSQALALGFDAVIPGPFSDTLLEKRFRQVVLDSGANPHDNSQIEAIYELLKNNDFVRAESVIRRGLKRFPEALPYVTLQCELHMRFQRHKEALLLAMTALHAHPGYTPLRHVAARCYVAEGNVSQAFIVLAQTEKDPTGEAFALRFDTFESVVRCLNNEGVRRAHGEAKGGAEDALGLYTHALESTAGFPDHHRYLLWHNMGMAYKKLNRLEKARQALSMAASLSPRTFTEAHVALAEVEQDLRTFALGTPKKAPMPDGLARPSTKKTRHEAKATPPPPLDPSFSTDMPSTVPTADPSPSHALAPSFTPERTTTLSALQILGSAVQPPPQREPQEQTQDEHTLLSAEVATALDDPPTHSAPLIGEDSNNTHPEVSHDELPAEALAEAEAPAETAPAEAAKPPEPSPILDDAARRQQRREARIKFIMFEKELQEG